jgi:uncharacterized protein (DUF1778 family)
MSALKQVARLNIRLAPEIKQTIERAAAHMGQTVSDFATASLIQAARVVIQDQNVTRLSERDRQRFIALLEDEAGKPNAALVKAARRYKKRVR